MKHLLFLAITILILTACSSSKTGDENETERKKELVTDSPYDLVNPFIGTGGHGHTFPGATMPFGMVQLSPDTRLDGWDGCGGYHFSDSIVYGFSHTHLSGTGVSDYGDVLLMPYPFSDLPKVDDLLERKIKSSFSKNSEVAKPGYYKMILDDYNTEVELTTTERVGIHKYKFLKAEGKKQIILDLNHRDKLLDAKIRTVNDTMITGYRISKAWAEEQHIYFAITFSKSVDIFPFDPKPTTKKLPELFQNIYFEDNEIMVKVAISAVDEKGAINNLVTEAPHWDFDQYVSDAKSAWEKQLAKIEVKGRDRDQMVNFYTALYHTMIVPNLFNDVDGRYRGRDQKIHKADHNYYTVFSLWDTFRAAHPLYGIIEPERTKDFVETMLLQYQQGGTLPVWELACNETGCMIGYHAVPAILDAYKKGIQFDTKLAQEAMMHSADLDHLGLSAYKEKRYIAAGDEAESVSKTLEYAYDDWCIAQMALANRDTANFQKYIKRAQYYKNIFNPETGFMQAKMNGAFAPNFNPSEVNFNFTEANSWQYSMFVPQDISGMIELYGGPKKFEQKLDELFSTEMELSGRHQVDITGLIGQYAHGNEPSHHMAYLYNYVGKPWKTQERIRQILTEQYWNGPDGLSGNEDCGQMSAWYVLSAMGIYSVTPGSDHFVIGAPLFEEVKINFDENRSFVIKAKNQSDKNLYIQSASLNGKELELSFINFFKMAEGGELVFEMGDQPNKSWASEEVNWPPSSIFLGNQIVPNPYSTNASQTFEEETEVELKSVCKDCKIMVSVNGKEFEEYTKPIKINSNTELKYYGQKGNKKSKIVSSQYIKIVGGRTVIYNSKYDNQYNAGGDKALVDFLKGSANFRTGFWQGFQGQDVEIIIDQGKIEGFKTVSIGVLQDIKSWIWFPEYAEISVANNLKSTFKECGKIGHQFEKDKYGAYTQELKRSYPQEIKARYIKIKLKYPGDVPNWHLGAGGKAWVFVDEVLID